MPGQCLTNIDTKQTLMKKEKAGKLWQSFLLMTVYVSIITWTMEMQAIEKPLIFPIPQEMEITGDIFEMNESVTILVPEERGNEDLFLARFLVRELSDKYGIALRIEAGNQIPDDRKVVVMGSIDNPLIKQFVKESKLEINNQDPGAEGYVLHVSSNKVVVAGWDDPGAFYGLQSLRQLIDNESGKKIQGIMVRDWPNLPFRGIRLYVPGPENVAFFKRFLRDFMALYKYNKVIIELNCMRLDNHPEILLRESEVKRRIQAIMMQVTD
jgi:hyaluronoglucosaminidase